MRKLIVVAFVLFISTVTIAQQNSNFGIKFSGFVKSDIFNDSRQTVTAREGHFLLYPSNSLFDSQNNDINGKSSFNMLSIQSRLKGAITGPDVLGAKTSALIEGAFFGHSNPDINGFRLRHAFAKLRWENSELLVGQYWHAMFITENFPAVVSFNTGVPFQPFSRNPQIRFTQFADNFKFVFTAMSQRDFTSTGPAGANSTYLRNNGLPELNFTLHYNSKLSENTTLLMGAGIDYLSLMPSLTTDGGYAADSKVSAISIQAFTKITSKDVTFKLEAVYGQNNTHLLMLGGYAVAESTNPLDPMGAYKYTPSKIFSIWSELHTNGKKWQGGIFTGYTENRGMKEDLYDLNMVYARGANIDYVFRVAPRVIYNEGKMRFAFEIEHTTAAYGDRLLNGKVKDSVTVSNLRFLVGVYYFF